MKIPGKIPILIRPSFWLVAALIGFLYSRDFVGAAMWTFVIFISVLFHELGHAITALFCGMKPRIELVAMGGMTFHEGDSLPFTKRFLIVFNGPFFGFLLFLFSSYLLSFPTLEGSNIAPVLKMFQYVNFYWTIINLVPVIPLDGGQLLRVVLEGIFGARGFRYSLIAGAIFACLISLGFFLFHQFLVGALFFLFAFQSFDAWQKTRLFSETDRNAAVKKSLIEAEELLQAGKKKEAKVAFEKVRFEAKQGLIFNMATQYQAFLEYEEGDVKKTYELLKSAQSDLAPDGLCLLHKAAFEEKDYILVVKLASECFQNIPSVDTALRNAYAHAELKQAQAAIGWLETAVREGLQNFKDILSYSSFDLIRADPIFLKWIEDHKTST